MSDMTSINDWKKKTMGDLFRLYLKSGWVFESSWEKLILVSLCGLGIWKIIGLIW